MDQGISVAEAARRLVASRQSVENWIARGDLAVVKPGGKGQNAGKLVSIVDVERLRAERLPTLKRRFADLEKADL